MKSVLAKFFRGRFAWKIHFLPFWAEHVFSLSPSNRSGWVGASRRLRHWINLKLWIKGTHFLFSKRGNISVNLFPATRPLWMGLADLAGRHRVNIAVRTSIMISMPRRMIPFAGRGWIRDCNLFWRPQQCLQNRYRTDSGSTEGTLGCGQSSARVFISIILIQAGLNPLSLTAGCPWNYVVGFSPCYIQHRISISL